MFTRLSKIIFQVIIKRFLTMEITSIKMKNNNYLCGLFLFLAFDVDDIVYTEEKNNYEQIVSREFRALGLLLRGWEV